MDYRTFSLSIYINVVALPEKTFISNSTGNKDISSEEKTYRMLWNGNKKVIRNFIGTPYPTHPP